MASSSSQTHNDTAPGLRARKQQQTRSDLIEAAAKLFADQGYHATTLDLIAKAEGYTKGAVYSHFTTNDEPFLAVLAREIPPRAAIPIDMGFARLDWLFLPH